MNSRKRRRKHWLFLFVPYIWDVLLIPYVNNVKIHPFGIPFLLIWMMLGVIIVSLSIGLVYYFDVKNQSAVETDPKTSHVQTT